MFLSLGSHLWSFDSHWIPYLQMTHTVQMTMNDAMQMTKRILHIVEFILFQSQLNKY